MTSQQDSTLASCISKLSEAIRAMNESPDRVENHDLDCNCTICLLSGMRVRPFTLGFTDLDPTYPIRVNWIHKHVLWISYDEIENDVLVAAIAKAMVFPRFDRFSLAVEDIDGHSIGYETFYEVLKDYCKQLKTSLPFLLLATDVLELPKVYRQSLIELFLMLIGDKRSLRAGAEAVTLIDSFVSHYLFSDESDKFMLPDPMSIDTKLDYNRDVKAFAIVPCDEGFEIDFLSAKTCFECEQTGADLTVVCPHANRMCSILTTQDLDITISYWTEHEMD